VIRSFLALGLLGAMASCSHSNQHVAVPGSAEDPTGPASGTSNAKPSRENKEPMNPHSPPSSSSSQPAKSIGQATMTQEGTIILDLRAEGPGGARGDARFTYPPNHKDYQMILKHLGGLKPGEVKPVPPFE
jgi:hypothetical protein